MILSKIANARTFRLLKVLTEASLRSRYRNTFYGLLWVLLYPILSYAVQVFAFTFIFEVKLPKYPVYLMAGVLPWVFLVQSVEMCTGIYLYWGTVLRNVPIPPIIIPLIQLLDNFLNYFFAYFVLILFFVIKGDISIVNVGYLVLPIFTFSLFVSSLCITFALINVKFRDLKFILTFVFSLLFYLTPVIYSIQQVPERIRNIVSYNPFYFQIRPFQELLVNGATRDFFSFFLVALITSLIAFVVFFIIWKKFKNNVVFYG